MNEQDKVLAQLNRPGWKVVGERPETQKVKSVNQSGDPVETEQPTGNTVWSIVGPNGQPDEVVVKASTPPGFGTLTQYQVVKGPQNNPQAPPQAAGWADQTWVKNADGSSTLYGRDPKDGTFKKVPNVPDSAAATSTTRPVTPTANLDIVKAPDGTPIAYRDPSTGNTIDLPKGATPAKPTIVDGPNGSKYSWDGEKLTQQLAGTPTAQEGQTRQSVIPGTQYVGQEIYHNGTWSIDPSFTPKQYVPTDKPKEGDVRPNVVSGQSVQEVYRGGSWVTDTSVAPKPFVPQPPQTISAPINQPNIAQQNPQTGEITYTPNQNYQASDVAGRVTQLKQQAQTKRDQLNSQVSAGQKTAEQAASEFDTWWSTNIDPVSQQLQQQQAQQTQDAQIKVNQEQRAQQAAEQSAYGVAQTAGQNAASRAQSLLPYMVGPGYGAAVNNIAGAFASGKAPQNLDIGNAVTFNAPDFNQIAEQATAQALAHLSPTAAGKVGAPTPQIPQGIDIQSALNRSQYQIGGTTTIAPDGTVTIRHTSPQQPFAQSGLPEGSNRNALAPALLPLAPNEQQIFGNYVPQAFAKGGVVTRPTLAVIGEAGPEAVVPLDSSRYVDSTIPLRNPYQTTVPPPPLQPLPLASADRPMLRTPQEVIEQADRRGLTGVERDLFIFGYTNSGIGNQFVRTD